MTTSDVEKEAIAVKNSACFAEGMEWPRLFARILCVELCVRDEDKCVYSI